MYSIIIVLFFHEHTDLEKVHKTPELMAFITKPLDRSKMKEIEKYL